MKKIIAITLAVLAMCALAVTAFASGSAEPEAAAQAVEETTIEAALTGEQALASALKAAGEKEADVAVTRNRFSEKETTDGKKIAVYTVKFSTETTTYQYILDASTGEIYYSSAEFQNPDVIFKSRDRGESRGEASGEADEGGRSGRASGEADEGGRSGRSRGEADEGGRSGRAGGEADEGGRSGRTGGEKRGRSSDGMDEEAGGETAVDGASGASVRDSESGGAGREASAEPVTETVTA